MTLFRGEPADRPEHSGAPQPRSSRRAVGVDCQTPLGLVAREMLSSTVESLLVFDTTGAVGRVTWRELLHAFAMGADPQAATAADFMVELDRVDDPFWAQN